MNPALLNFGLAQEQADGALGSSNNPISDGALTAIRSVKQSLAMDEAEKRRALGLGLMGFASSLSQPGHGQGLSGMLGAVNSGFSPAIQAYLNEQNRVEQQNANVLKTVIDAQDKQADRDYRERQLQETKRYHNIVSNKQRQEEKALKNWEEVQKEYPEAIPFSSMTKNEQNFYTKKDTERLEAPIAFKKTVKILDNLVDLVDKNPHLSTSWTAWLGGESVPAKMFSNQKDRTLIEKGNALANQLVLAKAESGVGGARVGQFLEQIMAKSKANLGLTQETINFLRDLSVHELKELESDRDLVRKGMRGKPGIGRIHIPSEYKNYEELNNAKNNLNPLEKLSDDELDARINAMQGKQ